MNTEHSIRSIEKMADAKSDEYVEQFESRFWDKVDKSGDCWEWCAGTDNQGYGRISFDGSNLKANRVSLWLDMRQELGEKKACHTCHNKSCVNPNHLYLGTRQDNVQDEIDKGDSICQPNEGHGRARLSNSEIREMRKLYSDGDVKTYVELANMYNITRQYAGAIIRREYRTGAELEP